MLKLRKDDKFTAEDAEDAEKAQRQKGYGDHGR